MAALAAAPPAAVAIGHPGGIFETGNGPLWFAP
jgi:hypothetical protein